MQVRDSKVYRSRPARVSEVQQMSHDVKQYVADPVRSNPQVHPCRDPYGRETAWGGVKTKGLVNKEKEMCDWN